MQEKTMMNTSTSSSPSSSFTPPSRRLAFVMTALVSFTVTTSTTAFTSPSDLPRSSIPSPTTTSSPSPRTAAHTTSASVSLEQLRKDWADRSVSYYSKIMREERRRSTGQVDADVAATAEYQHDFQVLAKKHYFALRKIKDGRYTQAELIYKRIINEILTENEDETCDHAKLAVTTLLLALHCQRMGDMKKTRSVFLSFFRVVTMDGGSSSSHHHSDHDDGIGDGVAGDGHNHHHHNNNHHPQCACSAKVLGAFALFEMKQGNAMKSLQIAKKAVEFDPLMAPVLNWKQFRDVNKRRRQTTTASRSKTTTTTATTATRRR